MPHVSWQSRASSGMARPARNSKMVMGAWRVTAKEQRYVRNLEIKVEQLEQALKRSQTTWADQFTAIYETRTALLQSFAAIEEAAVIMHNCIKDDPQYMAERKRIEVIPNF